MPKKKKSNSKRPPQNRPLPLPRTQVAPPFEARALVPKRSQPGQGTPHPSPPAPLPQLDVSAAAPTRTSAPAKAAVPGVLASDDEDQRAQVPYGVGPTYWIEGQDADVPSAVRFLGTGVDGDSRGQRFERYASVPELPAGVGRTSVTAPVRGLATGTWHILAQGVDELGRPLGVPQQEDLSTKLWPFVRGPGVRPWAWSTLVLLGVALAVAVQVLLVRAEGLDALAAGLSAVAAAVLGYFSAKVGYMVLHRVPPAGFASAGTLIQAFLVGAFGALVGLAWLVDLPVLQLLDLTTPGVFAAMALARPGCWLGGCCAGRPTASRFGLWSSDRRVGVRRVPVQLMESGLAGSIALGSLAIVLTVDQRPYGVVLALAASVYTLGRQMLFPLRSEARRTSGGRIAAMAGASAAVAISTALLLVA
jgi:phosphatidylglycerol:prolipoprotein diacylglycerol transferase